MTNIQLLERAGFLDELSRLFACASAGAGQVVLLGGEAGSGKTSLVTALVDSLPATVTVRSVSCDAAGILGPLGPVFDIADSFGPQVAAVVEHDTSVDRITRAILGELRGESEANILVAEDVHWADQATLDLLRFLARRLDRTHTLLIATFRDDSLGPGHELRLLLGELTNQANVARISLPPLSLAAVSVMAERSGLDPRAVYDLTGGNPYFVSEIVNARSETIPHSIREVVLARAARLDQESRVVVDLAAMVGPVVDARLLQTICQRDIAPDLERGMHVGLLRSTSDGIIFRHALTRDVILQEISAVRQVSFAQRILETLEADPARASNVALLAHFAELADDAEAVRRYAIAAARASAERGAHRQAVLQYDRALRFSQGMDDAEVASLLEARSFELHVTSQNDRAIEDISRAIEIRSRSGDARLLGDDLRRRSRYHWIAARGDEAEADALAALGALDTGADSVELAMAYSNLAQLRMLSQSSADAVELGQRAIEMARHLDAPHVVVHAMTNVGTALMQMDGPGLELLEEAAREAMRLGLHDDVSRSYTNRVFLLLQHLDLERTKTLALEGIGYTDEHDILSLNQYLRALHATALVESGAYDAAESTLVQLLAMPLLLAPTRIVTLTGLGLLGMRQGGNVEAVLDEALELAQQANEAQRLGPVRAARAEAAWLAGNPETALHEAQRGIDVVAPTGDRWLGGLLGAWIARVGGDVRTDIPMTDPFRLETEGKYLEAADLWHVLGHPVQEARARAATGDVDQLRSALQMLQSIDARADAARVSKQLRQSGVSSVPKGPRERTRENPAQLTDREMDVLRLLATGKTNREIGEALFISPRTCGHHVSAILAKLGVQSRSDAVTAARSLGFEK